MIAAVQHPDVAKVEDARRSGRMGTWRWSVLVGAVGGWRRLARRCAERWRVATSRDEHDLQVVSDGVRVALECVEVEVGAFLFKFLEAASREAAALRRVGEGAAGGLSGGAQELSE